MGASLKDIACKLNLSKTTVSWVLSRQGDKKGISAKTQSRVLACARSLAYEPNLLARSLNTGVSKTIGLILPSISDTFFAHIADRIESEAEQEGYSLMIAGSNSETERENALIRLFRSKKVDGIIIAPGFGQRGIEGKFVALKWCREHDMPTFGICLGMQCMVIEFARNVLGLKDANSTEMNPQTHDNVIDLMEEQKNVTNMGGSMRLGAYDCILKKGSKAYEAYGQTHIQERHRHRFEFNSEYRDKFEAAGMMCVGENPESNLVEVVEIPALKWFVGVQFHPEYNSTVVNPNPLFVSFVKAAVENKK